MVGCRTCKTELVARVGGVAVCYYCGGRTGDEFQIETVVEIKLGDDLGGEIAGDPITIIDDYDTYHLDD